MDKMYHIKKWSCLYFYIIAVYGSCYIIEIDIYKNKLKR